MIKTLLIIGNCGVGKTWIMRKLIEDNPNKPLKLGKFLFHETDKLIIVGKYDGSVFEGSDRLSMSVITDLDKMLMYIKNKNKISIFEGDRFTNSVFIKKANPEICKILGDGEKGRLNRKSKQSTRHLKNMSSRVDNIKAHKNFNNSLDCFAYIQNLILQT